MTLLGNGLRIFGSLKVTVIARTGGSLKTSPVKDEKPMPHHCGESRKYFSVKTGSVMQSSKVALEKWVIAIYLFSTSLKGVSSMKLYRDLSLI